MKKISYLFLHIIICIFLLSVFLFCYSSDVYAFEIENTDFPGVQEMIREYNLNPYIEYYRDENTGNIAWTTVHPGHFEKASSGGYIQTDGSIYRNTYGFTVIPGAERRTPAEIPTGYHRYSGTISNDIVPVGKWVYEWDGKCIHGYEGMDEYYSVRNTYCPCDRFYDGGWAAYCADCGQRIDRFVYTSYTGIRDIKYIYCGVTPGIPGTYVYFCPYDGTNLEQGAPIMHHECSALVSANIYYIDYDANGGEGDMMPSAYLYDNADMIEGRRFISNGKLRKNTFAREGYVFDSWNTERDGSGDAFADEVEIYNLTSENEERITLYAIWRQTESELIISPGKGTIEGSKEDKHVTEYYGTELHLDTLGAACDDVIRVSFYTGDENVQISDIETGYSFTGWYRDEPFHGEMSSTGMDAVYRFKGEGPDHITAMWTGESVVLPDASVTGKVFDGWFTDDTYTMRAGYGGDSFIPSGDCTLYAKWDDFSLRVSTANFISKPNSDLSWPGLSPMKYLYTVSKRRAGDDEWAVLNPSRESSLSVQDINGINTGEPAEEEINITQDGLYHICVMGAQGEQELYHVSEKRYAGDEGFTESKTDFAYTGGIQSFIAPYDGIYELEVWGASGGSGNGYSGGAGGYTRGYREMEKGDVLYVVVGGKGGDSVSGYNLHTYAGAGGYNGGTAGYSKPDIPITYWDDRTVWTNMNEGGGGGGGATHIAINRGALLSDTSVSDLLIAAGGGGGTIKRTLADTNPENIRSNGPDGVCLYGGNGGGDIGAPTRYTNYTLAPYNSCKGGGFRTGSGYCYGGSGYKDGTPGFTVDGNTYDPLMRNGGNRGNGKAKITLVCEYYEADRYHTGGKGASVSADYYLMRGDSIYLYAGQECSEDAEHEKKSGERSIAVLKRDGNEYLLLQAGGGRGATRDNNGIPGGLDIYRDQGQLESVDDRIARNNASFIRNDFSINPVSEAGFNDGGGRYSFAAVRTGIYSTDTSMNGIICDDTENPNAPVNLRMDKRNTDRFKFTACWDEPSDRGTYYDFKVDAVNIYNGQELCSSQLNILHISGTDHYEIYISDSEGDRGELYEITGELSCMPADRVEDERFLHIYTADRAGNISEPVIIRIPPIGEYIPGLTPDVYTRKISIDGEYIFAKDDLIYVRASDNAPFNLYGEGYIEYPTRKDGYQINKMGFCMDLIESGSGDHEADRAVTGSFTGVWSERGSSDHEIFTDGSSSPLSVREVKEFKRYNNYKDVSLSEDFLIPEGTDGHTYRIYPKAGLVNDDMQETYSARDRDLLNGIVICSDGKAPDAYISVNGCEEGLLEGYDISNIYPSVIDRREREVEAIIRVNDTGSGAKEYKVVISNLDNGYTRTYNSGGDDRVVLNLKAKENTRIREYDDPLFNGRFTITVTSTDYVGNTATVGTHESLEIDVQGEVLRDLDAVDDTNAFRNDEEPPLFHAGESGHVRAYSWGYADRVKVEFDDPKMSVYDAEFDYPGGSFMTEDDVFFRIPLDYGKSSIIIRITAMRGDVRRSWSEEIGVDVNGSILDELRTILR